MNPEIEAINRQKREEVESRGRAAFVTFNDAIEPHKAKARQLLKSFSPIAAEAQKLASEAATIQNAPDQIAGLAQDIFNVCHSIPMRINTALAEIDATTPHDLAFDPEHEAKYREGESKFNRLVITLNPGDVCRVLATKTAMLREQLTWLAKNVGADSATIIPAAPVSSAPPTVRVNSGYNPLRK
jgi:hypothetical protein